MNIIRYIINVQKKKKKNTKQLQHQPIYELVLAPKTDISIQSPWNVS